MASVELSAVNDLYILQYKIAYKLHGDNNEYITLWTLNNVAPGDEEEREKKFDEK